MNKIQIIYIDQKFRKETLKKEFLKLCTFCQFSEFSQFENLTFVNEPIIFKLYLKLYLKPLMCSLHSANTNYV